MSGAVQLFKDEAPEADTLTINTKYATSYNVWRRNEDLQKLKDRYGADAQLGEDDSDDSSSEEEDEHGEQWTAEHEKHFLQTLATLKSTKRHKAVEDFPEFEDRPSNSSSRDQKPALTLRDAQRLLVTEHQGKLVDEDEDAPDEAPTYDRQTQLLKQSFREIAAKETADDAPLLKPRVKSVIEQKREDDEYLEWLKTQDTDQSTNNSSLQQLEPLRSFWNNPELGEGERFLRDYILERKYDAPNQHDTQLPTYDEIVHEVDDDDRLMQQQAQFEHKYNFRFEEPDQEFIKSYPRTITDTARRIDERRKEARQEQTARKQKEKQQRHDEISRLKAMKRDQINEKLARLQRIAGVEMKALEADDLEKDFDPAEYDAKMQAIFANEDDCAVEDNADVSKPVFSDMSDADMDSDYDQWTGIANDTTEQAQAPKKKKKDVSVKEESVNGGTVTTFSSPPISKRQAKKQSALQRALQRKKPVFDPDDKTFTQYYDEYYQLDCEDTVGDLQCRFKYRQVAPNDFGLSANEVLSADDRELNGWVSLRKMSQYRAEREEHYDQISYAKKAANLEKKRKLLPSAFSQEPEKKEDEEEEEEEVSKKKNRRRQKRKKTETGEEAEAEGDKKQTESEEPVKAAEAIRPIVEASNKKERNKKHKATAIDVTSDERLKAFGINPKKFRNKQKYAH